MAEIIPAVIPKSVTDLAAHLEMVRGLVSVAQIDICDGVFVPSRSWPHSGVDRERFQNILDEKEGLPFWQDFDFEIDLMVKNVEQAAEEWKRAGATRLIFHVESTEHISKLIKKFREPGLLEIGIAINIETPLETIEQFVPEVDVVQCMGINRIGFQGEKFDERVLSKVISMRKEFPDAILSVDGGVNLDSAEKLVEAGVNRLIAGSAIFNSSNPREVIEYLKSL